MARIRSTPDRGQLVGVLQLGQRDVATVANRLYAIKARAYRDTLVELSGRHGRDRSRAVLSAEIREALRHESDSAARQMVETYNRMISDFAERRRGHPPELLARELSAYARTRARTRSRVAARMAPIAPRLDATIAFYRENGVEPEFDFVGPRPKCELCRKLKAGGPFSVAQVLAVGFPHLGCTHTWRARTKAVEQLRAGGLRPGQISAGRGGPAGILNTVPLIQRAGGHDLASGVIDEIVAGTRV